MFKGKKDQVNITGLITGFFLGFVIYIIMIMLASLSTYSVYIGEFNQTNIDKLETACGQDELLGYDGGCNRITAICKDFWYPVHTWTNCYDGRITRLWWWQH